MRFVSSYFKAFIKILKTVGLAYLLVSLTGNDILALYLLFVSIVAACAGPISVLINERKHLA